MVVRYKRFRRYLMPIVACISLWLVLALLVACGKTSLACASPTQSDLSAGMVIFNKPEMCATCHPGGNSGVGPQLRGTDNDQGRIAGIIRDGKGDMHGYSVNKISDAQACQVAAYVKSLK